MIQSPEWSKLMAAPWGKFTPEAKAAKEEAQKEYERGTEKFWARRGKQVPK